MNYNQLKRRKIDALREILCVNNKAFNSIHFGLCGARYYIDMEYIMPTWNAHVTSSLDPLSFKQGKVL